MHPSWYMFHKTRKTCLLSLTGIAMDNHGEPPRFRWNSPRTSNWCLGSWGVLALALGPQVQSDQSGHNQSQMSIHGDFHGYITNDWFLSQGCSSTIYPWSTFKWIRARVTGCMQISNVIKCPCKKEFAFMWYVYTCHWPSGICKLRFDRL